MLTKDDLNEIRLIMREEVRVIVREEVRNELDIQLDIRLADVVRKSDLDVLWENIKGSFEHTNAISEHLHKRITRLEKIHSIS